ncbi:daunorubicin C-13 ketoreductase [Tetragenococcus muriaticus PMC-11-5]|nr:SDR family NAD(P)-dependent oxidoreductase [Tetragenococcus muriaticus]KFN92486.1 daunorubicin C-13 ketoreductase [Tetragenococcus muriaticus PMC-11-5]GMA46523.1 short-chain dehydrogenase [Tetragenococcus muriaticus]
MAKVFITGSSTGLGALTAKELIAEGSEVVLHARNDTRAEDALKENPEASHVVVGDLSKKEEIISIADQVNQLGPFDAVIHNAGVMTSDSKITATVNIEAPYMLTKLIEKTERLIYVSSDMHPNSQLDINNLAESVTYSGSKLAILLLMKSLARLYPNIIVNAVDPGWVPTRMGGTAANDSLQDGYLSQIWLATATDSQVLKSGNYYYHKKLTHYDERVDTVDLQNNLLTKLEKLTKIKLEK